MVSRFRLSVLFLDCKRKRSDARDATMTFIVSFPASEILTFTDGMVATGGSTMTAALS